MVLEKIDESIWLSDGNCVDFFGFPYPVRMVIVRLPDGGLWVWSPIALTPKIIDALEELGPVAHLVSPNKLHYLFLADWKARWPVAKVWAPQSTIDKCKDLSFFENALEDVPPVDWQGVFEMAWVSGSRFMDEIIFHHQPSGTTILGDLSENFSEAFLKQHWALWQRVFARVWKIVEGYGYAPLEWRLTFFNKKKARRAKARILSWNNRHAIMAHGTWVRDNGQVFLEKSLAWL